MKLMLLLFLTTASFAQPVTTQQGSRVKILAQAKAFAAADDFVGFRIWAQKAYGMKMSHAEWFDMKNQISAFAGKAGYDLIPFWNTRNNSANSDVDVSMDKVDTLMLSNKFNEAFDEAQSALQKLKKLEKSRWDAKKQFPYIYHAMARALYGAKRYDEALTVYQWIPPNYPFFRQTLFEKMWAAFKLGRVDMALGAVASQKSNYFSKYLIPEAYLIQTYLYKRLCRESELQSVISEMKEYEALLQKNNIEDWAEADVHTVTLWRISERKQKETDLVHVVTAAERTREQNQIKEALTKAYQKQRDKILKDLKVAIAYAHLAKVTDTKDVLKPVTALKSRDQLLKQNLEVWPADSTEEWIDEMGKHVLIGESLCNQDKK